MLSAVKEFERMVERLSQDNALADDKNGNWSLWKVGEDWQMSKAELAQLEEAGEQYYPSIQLGEIEADEDGVIRTFKFAAYPHRYTNTSLLRQLSAFIDLIDIFSYCDANLDLTLEAQGNCIAVDVVLIEVDSVSDDSSDDGYRELPPTRRTVGQFLYHPMRQVLTHRS